MVARAFDVVIAGAGVCGLAVARHLIKKAPDTSILIVTRHPPMAFTSSLSTECFRDHWPTLFMRDFMRRSIHLLQDMSSCTGAFSLQRHGYLYVSTQGDVNVASSPLLQEAQSCHEGQVRMNAAPLRADESGADVFTDKAAIARNWGGFLSPDVSSAMIVRNAGWLPAHTMGMTMLEELHTRRDAQGRPQIQITQGGVHTINCARGREQVQGVTFDNAAGERETVSCGSFVNAAGPFLDDVHLKHSCLIGKTNVRLPVHSEIHAKTIFRDRLRVIPRDAPMTICNDPIKLSWTAEEEEMLHTCLPPSQAAKAIERMGAGAHFRPYGGAGSDVVLMLWEQWHEHLKPEHPMQDSVVPLLDTDFYPEILLRGLSRIVPGLRAYYEGAHAGMAGKSAVDGGYYTKTPENVPLIGPAPLTGGPSGDGAIGNSYIAGAVSGYGIMACQAAGELAAQHILQESSLPSYAPYMNPMRYSDPAFIGKGGILQQLHAAGGGQL